MLSHGIVLKQVDCVCSQLSGDIFSSLVVRSTKVGGIACDQVEFESIAGEIEFPRPVQLLDFMIRTSSDG